MKKLFLGSSFTQNPNPPVTWAEPVVSKKRAPTECSEVFILDDFLPSHSWTLYFTAHPSKGCFYPSAGLLFPCLIPHTNNFRSPTLSLMNLESEVPRFNSISTIYLCTFGSAGNFWELRFPHLLAEIRAPVSRACLLGHGVGTRHRFITQIYLHICE